MGLIRLPRLGETMEEARVVLWLKAPGESFSRGEVLLEVETDKTVVEVPALENGRLTCHLVAPGETVALGQAIAETDPAGDPPARPSSDGPKVSRPPPMSDTAPPASAVADSPSPEEAPRPQEPAASRGGIATRVAASPRARRLARDSGLDLSNIQGTGRRGRVAVEDVARLARTHHPAASRAPSPVHLRRRAPAGPATSAPLVLLHGLFDTARGWRDLPERLTQAGHPVLVPDLPGHGRSAPGDGTLEAAEDALVSILPEQGPVGLVGHSLGAVLAARLALRLKGRLDRLVLVAPVGLGPRMDAEFFDLMANAHSPASLSRALARLGPGGGPYSEEALVAELARLAPQREAMLGLGRGIARNGIQQTDIAPLLDQIQAPIVAVFGLDDPVIDWRDCAQLPPHAAIHLLRGAGHLPHATRPDLLAELILASGAARDGPS